MSGWIIFGTYLAMILVTARAAIPVLMQRVRCGKDGDPFMDICRRYHGADCGRPIGEIRDRNIVDAATALGLGVVWPVTLVGLWVMRTAPHSDGELKRLNAQHEADIVALQSQLERNRRGHL